MEVAPNVLGRSETSPMAYQAAIPETLHPQSTVRARLGGIGRTTLWTWVRAGEFPAPVRVGPKRIMWRDSDVQRWIDDRKQVGVPQQQVAA